MSGVEDTVKVERWTNSQRRLVIRIERAQSGQVAQAGEEAAAQLLLADGSPSFIPTPHRHFHVLGELDFLVTVKSGCTYMVALAGLPAHACKLARPHAEAHRTMYIQSILFDIALRTLLLRTHPGGGSYIAGLASNFSAVPRS